MRCDGNSVARTRVHPVVMLRPCYSCTCPPLCHELILVCFQTCASLMKEMLLAPFGLSYLPQQSAMLSIRDGRFSPRLTVPFLFLLGLNRAILSFCVSGVDTEEQ